MKFPTMGRIARDLSQPWFREELRTSWAIAVLYRLPSLPLVWLAARMGLSPTSVTLAALVLALSLPLQALYMPMPLAAWAVAISAMLFQVLDCTDGTLARVTGRGSKRGGDLDFLVDMAQWGALYLAVGLLADRTLGAEWSWSLTAVIAVWLRLFARVVRDRLTSDPGEIGPPAAFHPAQLPMIFVQGLSGLIPLLPLTGGLLWFSVLFLLIYALLDLAESLLPLLSPPG